MSTPTKPTQMKDQFTIDEEAEEVEDGLDEVENVSGERIEFQLAGRKIKLKPGQKTRIQPAYARPRAGANAQSDKLPSQIACITGGRVFSTNPQARKEDREIYRG